MQRGGYRSVSGAARLTLVTVLAALVGGCQNIGDAYHNIGSASQAAIENAYRAAYQIADRGAHAYNGAYMSVYDALFGAAPATVDFRAVTPPPAPPGPLVVNRIIVLKRQRLLVLEFDDKVVKTYPVALGPDAFGRKREQGDGRTPEGEYRIDWKTADTRYTRELHISYPDVADRVWADEHHVDPGGAIFVHGMPRDYGPYDPPVWLRDWTKGCIAVGNAAVRTIYNAVPDGTPIDILP